MILKGNQRGGGQKLAAHLLNSFDNERVEVVDVRGAVAHDLPGAFNEWYAQSLATKAVQPFYHLSLSPDQAQRHLTREEYLELIDKTERSLDLVGQPRAVVFHEKWNEEHTVLREHCHVVWSRIRTDEDKVRAAQLSNTKLKLRTVAREFAREHGLELPEGMKPKPSKDRNKFNNRARQENLAERQQKERTGVGKDERLAEITGCWRESSDGPTFVRALEAKGYTLARGERKGKPTYVVVDMYGEVHSLSRYLEGVNSKQMKERLKGSHPFDKLPAVDDARAAAKEKLEQLRARIEEAHKQPVQQESARRKAEMEIEKRKAALLERQQARRSELDKMRGDLHARHFAERGALREMQAAHHASVAAERQEKQPKGLAAFLTRITGVGKIVAWAQEKADRRREELHKAETKALLKHQEREIRDMERHYRALDALEARENRSAAMASMREGYRGLRQRTFALKPEFDKALARQQPVSGTSGDARKFSDLFKRIAEGVGFTKGDLQAAFERAHDAKTQPKTSGDGGDRAPDNNKDLDRARQLREELEGRQQQKKDRDKDRDL